jgi:hypothetical protein
MRYEKSAKKAADWILCISFPFFFRKSSQTAFLELGVRNRASFRFLRTPADRIARGGKLRRVHACGSGEQSKRRPFLSVGDSRIQHQR